MGSTVGYFEEIWAVTTEFCLSRTSSIWHGTCLYHSKITAKISGSNLYFIQSYGCPIQNTRNIHAHTNSIIWNELSCGSFFKWSSAPQTPVFHTAQSIILLSFQYLTTARLLQYFLLYRIMSLAFKRVRIFANSNY